MLHHSDESMKHGKVTCVLGAQWGDEGKGKLVDYILHHQKNIVLSARCQGGANAGHTLVTSENQTLVLHLVPCGLLHPNQMALIGHGVVVDLPSLYSECQALVHHGLLQWQDITRRLCVAERAHLVFHFHKDLDAKQEQFRGSFALGTTRRGIGPAYSDKASRTGFRVIDLYHPKFQEKFMQAFSETMHEQCQHELSELLLLSEWLKPMVVDGVTLIHRMMGQGDILVEGANAAMLDLDLGTYPFVTSSNTTVGGALTGLGLSPQHIHQVIGVVKAYTTRVGSGPFPTQLNDAVGDQIQSVGHEFGATTGRKRRCGWLDLVQLRYIQRINGFTGINLTKLDVLDSLKEIKVGVAYWFKQERLLTMPADADVLNQVEVEYETLAGWQCTTGHCRDYNQLPEQAKEYISFIESNLDTKVMFIGVGAGTDAMIVR